MKTQGCLIPSGKIHDAVSKSGLAALGQALKKEPGHANSAVPMDRQLRPARRHFLAVMVILMAGMGCLVLALVFSNCGILALPVTVPGMVVGRKVQEGIERRKGPIPESEWNQIGIWYRVSDNPLTFLPKGYGRNLPRTEQTGTWVVDERDGKRLFVPKGGVNGFSDRVLLVEAKNATNWKVRPDLKITPETLVTGKFVGD